MHYRIFLDSNIYIGEGYSFRGRKLNRIKELCEQGTATLVTNDIVEHEVHSHIEKELRKSVPALAKVYKDHSLALFKTNGYLNVPEAIIADNWILTCKQEYGLYLGSCHAENIKSDNINGSTIRDAYLSEQVPFSKEKPNEFKDAFILTELTDDIIYTVQPRKMLYIVISNDGGFREGLLRMLKTSTTAEITESVRIYERLSDFCDDMAQLDRQGFFLKSFMAEKSHQAGLREHITQLMEVADFDLTGDDFYDSILPEEAELLSVKNLNIVENIIDIGDPVNKCANVEINVSAVVTARYSWIDDQRSFWDMDRDFHPYTCEETASYQVQFDVFELYDYKNCVVPADWQSGDRFDFSGMMMNIKPTSVEPLRIELNQDNRM